MLYFFKYKLQSFIQNLTNFKIVFFLHTTNKQINKIDIFDFLKIKFLGGF